LTNPIASQADSSSPLCSIHPSALMRQCLPEGTEGAMASDEKPTKINDLAAMLVAEFLIFMFFGNRATHSGMDLSQHHNLRPLVAIPHADKV
jgi:hypothetical protein